jgi:hypothetical protein
MVPDLAHRRMARCEKNSDISEDRAATLGGLLPKPGGFDGLTGGCRRS